MRVSYRWLRELLPWLEASPEELGARLTAAGLELEALHPVGVGLEPVVLAQVVRVEAHPSRSGLRLVTVDRGGVEQRVVCGAPNVPEPGGQVVLAPVGTTLAAAGLTLTPREIGGVLSEGMLCSAAELGLSSEGGGILCFEPGSFTPGTPLVEALPVTDTVLELGVTPNRPDALGHWGLAREIAALYGRSFTPPAQASVGALAAGGEAPLRVELLAPSACGYYGAAVVRGLKVGPSAPALRWRLQALGQRPINNLVDLTNLVLLETGQPLHAFDLRCLRGGRLEVRQARPQETLTTLDGVVRQLHEDDLVIADGQGPTALAGVMGGAGSEITAQTTEVLLECAWFSPRRVRRSARRHGLHTEASHRFERGVDFGASAKVLRHSLALLLQHSVLPAPELVVELAGEVPTLPSITLRAARLDAVLGVPTPPSEAWAALERLGFQLEASTETQAVVRAASHRPDVTREIDLIEEVGRLGGLDRIPAQLPAFRSPGVSTAGVLARQITTAAAALGLSEALTYGFVSPRALQALHAPTPTVELRYPLSEQLDVLRTSLLPGLLEALRNGRRHGERAIRLFSVGTLFLAPRHELPAAVVQRARPRRPEDLGRLPEERLGFAAVLSGPRPSYLSPPEEVDLSDLKGLAEALLATLTGHELRLERSTTARHLHPKGAAEVLLGDQRVGCLGPLHPEVLDAFELDGSAQVLELDLDAVEALPRREVRYRPIPRMPAVVRDLALTAEEGVEVGQLQALIEREAGPLCESVELFDVYRGEGIAPGQRSLAFRVTYRDPMASEDVTRARTLTDMEVDERHARVLAAAKAQIGAALRA